MTREIPVDGGVLQAHVRAGRSPALVFLHYWGGSHRTWDRVIDRLDPEVGAVAYDHRGWGEASDLGGPFDLGRLADDAQRVIGTLGLTDYVLVGHSMGGKVAQLIAGRRPRGLAGAVLVAPAPPDPGPTTGAARDALAHAYDDADAVNTAIDRVLTAHGLAADLRAQVVEDSLAGSDGARQEWPRRGIVSDISREAGRIEVPVLVLAGSDDRVDPPADLKERLLPHVPTARLVTLTDTGHLSPLEVPEQLAAHLGQFLRRT